MSDDYAGLTVEAARRQLAADLRRHAIDTPDLDARLLVGAALDLDLTGLARHATRLVAADEAIRLRHFAARRVAGAPVARIVGVKEFWGLPLTISPATLVPRPDTETVVEAAVDLVRSGACPKPGRILDIGTGSGALLLALLSEFPEAFGCGTDIDAEALATAAGNARRLGLAARAGFVRCDYAAPLAGSFDLIVSNPPYIPSAQIGALETEVRDHDPRRALDGGPDGLDAYRLIVPQAVGLLGGRGYLLLEVGRGQSGDVGRLAADAGLSILSPRRDLGGVARVVIGGKSGPQGLPEQ